MLLHANLLSLLITAVIIVLCYTWRHRLLRDFDVFIRRVALLIFVAGFVVYFIGFRTGHENLGTNLSWYASFFRPLLSSMEMFAFHSDLLEVGEPCHENMLYMTVFSVVHFAAASVSFAVAINYLGVRIRSALRWRRLRAKQQLEGDIHVFFGINNVSLILAKDIRKFKPHDTIIFLNTPDDQSNQGLLGFARLFNVFSFRREIMAQINRIHGIIRQIRVPVHLMEGNDVLRQLQLDTVLAKTHEFMNLYLLGDDQLINLSKNIKLRSDEFFTNDKNKKAYIYCHATSGKVNGGTAFEYNSRAGVETVLVDASQLAVKTMLCKTATHPVNFVDFDTRTGEAKSTFHCMIIGFGETGQEAFKFLYEFGQFAYPKDYKGPHAVFHIVDPKAAQKQGFFEMRYPAMKQGNDFSPLKVEIHWHSHSAGDGRFWELMADIKDQLNYVVVATGSDNRDIAITYDLAEYALRWRKRQLQNFCIVTRCYDAINESRFDEMAQLCVDERDGKQVVNVIGKMSECLCHRYVWKSQLEHDAYVYSATLAKNFGRPLMSVQTADAAAAFKVWWHRHVAAKGNPMAYANVKRIESQDTAQAFHIYTKLKVIGLLDKDHDPVGAENLRLLLACTKQGDLGKLPFAETLLRMEHARSLASHEALGYTPMTQEEFDELRGKTDCDVVKHTFLNLVPWERLNQMPSPEWLALVTPDSYEGRSNEYLLGNIVNVSLALGKDLYKLK